MRGIIFPGDMKVTVKDFPDPKIGKGEALIRMKASGLCGSDLHALYEPSEEERLSRWEGSGIEFPTEVIPGHESCGVVEELDGCVDWLSVGDRVIVYQYKGCGKCVACRSGWMNYCKEGIPPTGTGNYGWTLNGGDADFLVADARSLVPLPDFMGFAEGAMCACHVGTAYQASKKLGVSPNDTVALFGLGPVGLGGLLINKALGAKPIIGVDLVEERLKLARDLGADEVLNASEENPVERIKELTDGEGVNVAFDYSGNPEAQKGAIASLALWGRLGLVGMGFQPTTINLVQIVLNNLSVVGSQVFSITQLTELPEFLKRHKIQLERLVTHRFSIEEASKALELFESRKTGKIIFTWP